MIAILAFRNLVIRPWRSLLLLAGFGLGVGVMIVLLSIGDAMVSQSREEKLVGGGDITVLPEGVDIEVLKTGGVGGLYFSIPNARFVYLQLLASPRLSDRVTAVSPRIDGKLLYLTTADGREIAVRAAGEVPSATRAVGAMPELADGEWSDDDLDRRWRAPAPAELRHDIDHFHLPPDSVANRDSWGEWHYFNVLSADRQRWAFLTFMVAGEVPAGDWGAQVLLTMHQTGKPARRFSTTIPARDVRFSTNDADLTLGAHTVRVLPDGRYAVRARVAEEGSESGSVATVDLIVTPAPGAYFPGTSLGSGDFVSGYVVAGLRADASGALCVDGRCERYDGAQAYHDHNWGVWRGVTWEWGATRAGAFTLLYGRVIANEDDLADSPLFLYLVDSLGFRAVFRPKRIDYDDARSIVVDGRTIRVPARARMSDIRGTDTLSVELIIEDATSTDTRRPLVERGESGTPRAAARPYFIQMKGIGRITGRVGGKVVSGEGSGFFETYR